MLPHIPGTRRSFTNARFAQPGRNPTPHGDRHYPADQFPFTYTTAEDHLTGRRDGLLARCRATNTCPRIMQTDSEYEFWGARASLLVTDTRGNHLDLPPEVRAYMMTGAPALRRGAGGGGADRPLRPAGEPAAGRRPDARPAGGAGGLAARGRRAARQPLPDARARARCCRPPASTRRSRRWAIAAPSARRSWWTTPSSRRVVQGEYAVLLPRVDADGNAVGGVRSPVIEAPKATYTGWNPRAAGFAEGALCYNTGAVVPFAATKAERLRGQRPAALARGALRHPGGLCRRGEGGGDAAGGGAPAAGRGRDGDHRGGRGRHARQAAALTMRRLLAGAVPAACGAGAAGVTRALSIEERWPTPEARAAAVRDAAGRLVAEAAAAARRCRGGDPGCLGRSTALTPPGRLRSVRPNPGKVLTMAAAELRHRAAGTSGGHVGRRPGRPRPRPDPAAGSRRPGHRAGQGAGAGGVAALLDNGFLRLLLPRSIGGGDISLPDFAEICEAIAIGDASTAWGVCQGNVSAMTAAAYMAPEVVQSLFGDRRAALAWGARHNRAKAVIVEGGYRVTGVWDFASGNRHCTLLGAHMPAVHPDGSRAPVARGQAGGRDGALPARPGAGHAGMEFARPARHRQRCL